MGTQSIDLILILNVGQIPDFKKLLKKCWKLIFWKEEKQKF